MNRFHRSLLVAAVAGGICGGVGFVQAGNSNNSQAQHLAEHWKYSHMHRALEHLHEARHELESAEDIFRGHKEEALGHVDAAIGHVIDGLKENHDEATLPGDLPSANKLERYPHLHGALDRLREARKELEDADHIFGGHREHAIDETDRAIHQLEEGLK
jgi:hypothetical protein